jgi:hypothetical protein
VTIVPQPSPHDIPFNDPVSSRLDGGQKLVVEFETAQRVTDFVLPILAISKHPESSYEVWLDGEQEYGPSPIPPTDVDDIGPTFLPAKRFGTSMKVIVRNLSASTPRSYSVQPIGWEVSN